MIRVAVLALGLALGGPALALSCLPPDVAETYRRAAEAEEAYIVVQGRLEFDPARLPSTDMIPQQKPAHRLCRGRIIWDFWSGGTAAMCWRWTPAVVWAIPIRHPRCGIRCCSVCKEDRARRHVPEGAQAWGGNWNKK